ncbi:hypothetical protein KFL_009070030 [Klebsormidium nitens]|uniref:HNH nuclease domain-containing protein n=1 Tax=Klebsormidium nitens TaxID=105231 RepID=A0A1Y1IRZ8_KLENI|nr:hypothetical protein KFL_009070030 [Klebsormidium nitens]|eukprot:GAQ92031.1 hypothetical protein KFL_009070030 [Klebsormidium nitens]
MITGLWFPEKKIKAGHVYRQTWAPNVLEDANMTVHDPRNIILMLDQLEERFDKWHWTLLPIGDTVYQVYLLNPELREPGVSPRVKYLWSRGEKDEKKHNGSSGSGRGGKKGRPSEGLGCEQEQEMVEEGEADDDKKITSGSSADEVKEVSRAEEGGEEDGGRGSGLENGPQRPQGGRNGQEPVGTSGGGMRVDVANLDENGPTWASLHMKELRFEGSCQPAKRVCGFHAYMAIKDAETKGWILRGSVEVPDAAWGSPTFDKKLMDVYLHDSFEYASSVWSDSPHDAGSPENTPKGGELL